jgi:rod shape-determining protein MreC
MLMGDNSALPVLEFIEYPEQVRPGDRIVSSADGSVFPAGLLVGQVVLGTDRRLRAGLAADYARLEFLRVLRSHGPAEIGAPGALIAPEVPPAPDPDLAASEESADG